MCVVASLPFHSSSSEESAAVNRDIEVSEPRRSSRGTRDSSQRRSSSSQQHKLQKPHDHSNRVLVDHTYNDHLHDNEPPADPHVDKDHKNRQRAPRGGVTVAFPERLHEMLRTIDEEGLEDIVSWQPHGRCFIVRKKKEFIGEIMPRFFHQTKLTSFQRQLNLYGFVRLTAGRDRGAYYHELFLRGRPDLCRAMIRTRVKGNGMKAASNPQHEPDFYAMTPCPPSTMIPTKIDRELVVLSMDSSDASVTTECEDHPDYVASSPFEREKETNIVTPVSSPQRATIHFVEPPSVSVAFLELPDPIDSYRMTDEDDAPSTVSDEAGLHSGDEAFFEGYKFRYLDRIDILDDSLSPFLDKVSSTEFV